MGYFKKGDSFQNLRARWAALSQTLDKSPVSGEILVSAFEHVFLQEEVMQWCGARVERRLELPSADSASLGGNSSLRTVSIESATARAPRFAWQITFAAPRAQRAIYASMNSGRFDRTKLNPPVELLRKNHRPLHGLSLEVSGYDDPISPYRTDRDPVPGLTSPLYLRALQPSPASAG